MTRARLVSAAAFATAAAALPSARLVWNLMFGRPEAEDLVVAAVCAAAGAFVGALMGRLVLAAADWFDVVAIGVAATAASALLIGGGGALAETLGTGGDIDLWVLPYALFLAFIGALFVSPLGMLASYAAWRVLKPGGQP